MCQRTRDLVLFLETGELISAGKNTTHWASEAVSGRSQRQRELRKTACWIPSVIPPVLKWGSWRQQRKSQWCHVRTQPSLSSDGGGEEVQSQRRQTVSRSWNWHKKKKNSFPVEPAERTSSCRYFRPVRPISDICPQNYKMCNVLSH